MKTCMSSCIHCTYSMCPICTLVVRDPVQTQCGHPFCNSCLRRTVKDDTLTCPVCRSQLATSQIYPNKLQERQVLSLKIKCDRHGKGCEWTGELRDGEDHDALCLYFHVPCERNCGELVMRKDAVEHSERNCCKRTVGCEHCKHSVQIRYLKNHSRKCLEMPMTCVGCGAVFPRKEMHEHVGGQARCPACSIKCEFSEVGCQFEGNRETVMKHMTTDVEAHLSALMVTVKKQKLVIAKQEESQDDVMINMQYQIDQATSKISDQQRDMNSLQQQVTTLSQQLAMVRHQSSVQPQVLVVPPHQQRELNTAKQRIDQATSKISTQKQQIEQATSKISDQHREMNTLKQQVTTLSQQLATVRHQSSVQPQVLVIRPPPPPPPPPLRPSHPHQTSHSPRHDHHRPSRPHQTSHSPQHDHQRPSRPNQTSHSLQYDHQRPSCPNQTSHSPQHDHHQSSRPHQVSHSPQNESHRARGCHPQRRGGRSQRRGSQSSQHS